MKSNKIISRRAFGQNMGKISLASLSASTIIAILASCSKDGDENPMSSSNNSNGDGFSVDLNEHQTLKDVGGFKTFMVEGTPIVVIHTAESVFRSFSLVCTHQSSTVSWTANTQNFTCPCHGSRFDNNGQVTQGPAIRALTEYKTMFDQNSTVNVEI